MLELKLTGVQTEKCRLEAAVHNCVDEGSVCAVLGLVYWTPVEKCTDVGMRSVRVSSLGGQLPHGQLATSVMRPSLNRGHVIIFTPIMVHRIRN